MQATLGKFANAKSAPEDEFDFVINPFSKAVVLSVDEVMDIDESGECSL